MESNEAVSFTHGCGIQHGIVVVKLGHLMIRSLPFSLTISANLEIPFREINHRYIETALAIEMDAWKLVHICE